MDYFALGASGITRQQVLQSTAQKADFQFMISPGISWGVFYEGQQQDPWIIPGEGVPVLDEIKTLITNHKDTKVQLNIGETTESWLDVSFADVDALRTYYIGFWGTTSKPNYYQTNDNRVFPFY
jgi:hypothetical protein